MKTVALYNLGCKVNSYEIDGMAQKLQEKGYHIVPFEEKADIYIVNTCTVTNIADRKSRQMLHRAKQCNPRALVVAAGCYVQTGLEKVEKDDSIDLAIGNNRKKDIVEILEAYMAEHRDCGGTQDFERNAAAVQEPGRKVNTGTAEDTGSGQSSSSRQDAGREQRTGKTQDTGSGQSIDGTQGTGIAQRTDKTQDAGREQNSGKGQESGGIQVPHGAKTLQGTTVPDMSKPREYEEMQLQQSAEHTRAYIKIQDGCNQFCSYCVIPYARGRVRSRRAEDILQEVRRLVAAGYREVVLTGIHISSYGIDFRDGTWEPMWNDGKRRNDEGRGENCREEAARENCPKYNGSSKLVELTERIHEISGLERIRLGSLEPRIVNEETARRLAALPKLCPHFHLSLQSGCDATLKRMNRHYTTGEYYTCVKALRRCFDHPAITTDVIVGFPGETEAEFAQTKAFLEKVNFYEMHVFKYSRRSGTAADAMPDQVPEPVKTRRSGELLELTRRQSREFRAHYIGKEAEVLLEEKREIEGRVLLTGHTKDYVKIAVEPDFSLGCRQENTIVTVPVRAFLTDEILI